MSLSIYSAQNNKQFNINNQHYMHQILEYRHNQAARRPNLPYADVVRHATNGIANNLNNFSSSRNYLSSNAPFNGRIGNINMANPYLNTIKTLSANDSQKQTISFEGERPSPYGSITYEPEKFDQPPNVFESEVSKKKSQSFVRYKASIKRNNSSNFYKKSFTNFFKSNWNCVRQQANRAKQLVFHYADEVVKKKNEQSLARRPNLSLKMNVLDNLAEEQKVEPITEENTNQKLIKLTRDHLKRYDKLINGKQEEVHIFKFNLNITRQDISSLIENCWLNDTVINFYMNLLTDRSERKSSLPKVYAMNTYFVQRLIQGYCNVRRWTRKINIFTKDIILVPVHIDNSHWCMAIIHLKNRTIRYYDSQKQSNSKLMNVLKKYLEQESLDKLKMPFDTSDFVLENVKDLPQQSNDTDCGVFSCMFAEYITRNMPLTFSQADINYFRKKMVLEICAGELWM